jgi:hypothetical protein
MTRTSPRRRSSLSPALAFATAAAVNNALEGGHPYRPFAPTLARFLGVIFRGIDCRYQIYSLFFSEFPTHIMVCIIGCMAFRSSRFFRCKSRQLHERWRSVGESERCFPFRPLTRDGLASFLGAEGSRSHRVDVLGIGIVLAAPLRLPERLMPVIGM